MNSKGKLLLGAVSAAVLVATAPVAHADGSAFVGGLVGGIIGSAIGNQQRQAAPRQQTRTVVRQPAVNSYQREQNRQTQVALNYFGFPAGTPDGVFGRNSRAAASQYQAYLGYPPTGYLSDYERSFLITSYQRAIVGGPQTAQMMTEMGQGTRGLLIAFRNEAMGVPATPAQQQPQPQMVVAPQAPATVVVPQAPATVEAAAPAPEPAPAVPAIPAEVLQAAGTPEAQPAATAFAVPNFMPAPAEASMASHCNRTSLVTGSNGGYVTLASMGDPGFVLDEQFCLARTYVIEEGSRLAAMVPGVTTAEMEAQCVAFAPGMREYAAKAVSQEPPQVIDALQAFVVGTGVPPSQLAANARICLGIGYRTDNAELSLAAAMLLVGLGEAAYAELLGHHLVGGFGMPKRTDRGLDWLAVSVMALEDGATPVVSPGAPERVQLLRQAVAQMGDPDAGKGEVLTDAATPAVPNFTMPVKPAPQSN
jgi:hypothetical protein